MKCFNMEDHPHRRLNVLTHEWVLVSPHRTKRPWQGQVEKPPSEEKASYDPGCYMCPGNERAGGARNPKYTGTFVFDNDFSPLLPDAPQGEPSRAELLLARSERGLCRVVCFSPWHHLTLAEMEVVDIRRVVDVWVAQYLDLGARPFIRYVQIFENKGAMMGCSNPHPHGQIWSSESLPNEPGKEQTAQADYLSRRGSCLLCDYVTLELEEAERVVCQNSHFLALVPFWATWPFEVMLLSKRHAASLADLRDAERDGMADIIRRVTARYDNLFRISFPYSMGLHQQPTDDQAHPHWHLHAHFYPPLLRSATVRKFMVGYEMLSEPQRDLTAEASAARLRALSEIHYGAQR
jgi:UDPglucose--hexose-1-phosphate uridylyltransferase